MKKQAHDLFEEMNSSCTEPCALQYYYEARSRLIVHSFYYCHEDNDDEAIMIVQLNSSHTEANARRRRS
jgi:hypothetical protein